MDATEMKLQREKIWGKRSRALFKNPAKLVWDQFRAHTTESTKKFIKGINTEIAVISESITNQLQPLDKLFKNFMRKEYNKRMPKPNHNFTSTGRMKRPTVSEVCTQAKNSWEAVKEDYKVI